jgi:hypothetical protein
MTSREKSIQEIMERSGNSFHSRVVKKLRDEEWSVLVSPYYSDNFTDKPREIDIIAEKRFDVKEVFGDWLGTLNVRLFIECKYINGDIVFWFDVKDKERATERIMKDMRMEDLYRDSNSQRHHYYDDVPVAKLFASGKGRSEDNEVLSKAVNQNLNATVYYRDRSDLKLAMPKKGYIDKVIERVTYPLIVVNSFESFHATSMGGNSEIHPIAEPFQLEVNYAYTDKDRNGHNEYFLIDVVSIDKLSEFLENAVEKGDVPTITQQIIWNARMNTSRKRNTGDD